MVDGRLASLAHGWCLCLLYSLAGVCCFFAQDVYSQHSRVTQLASAPGSARDQLVEECLADKHCSLLPTDGTGPDAPALFLAAVTNEDINMIVLAAPRYVLKVAAWEQFKQNPYLLTRNLTITSSVIPYGVLDFSLLESRVLVATGAQVTFQNIVLQNIRKLGGWSIDFFVGQEGSTIVLQDVVRVKLACQLPQGTIRAAASFKRVSPAFPENNVTLWEHFCLDAAINGPQVTNQCYEDVMHFEAFSNIATSDDPSLGRQYAGYTLFQQNTTRVCQSTISQQCLDEKGGDEELCLVMLVTQSLNAGRSTGFVWTPGAIAGVAVTAAIVVIALSLCVLYRRPILMWCVKLSGKSLKDLEGGFRREQSDDYPFNQDPGYTSSVQSYAGRRAISQQVTLGVLLGAGSFGRVYRGRWHSSDVAIKIMSCTPDELPKVLKEAEVMMQLDHPNIVRAFHASVWNPAEQVRALKAREARSQKSTTSKDPARKVAAPQKQTSSVAASMFCDQHTQQQLSSAAASSQVLSSEHLVSSPMSSTRYADANHLDQAGPGSTAADAVRANKMALPAAAASGASACTDSFRLTNGMDHQLGEDGVGNAAATHSASPRLLPQVNGTTAWPLAEDRTSQSQGSSQPLKMPSTGSFEAHPPPNAFFTTPLSSSSNLASPVVPKRQANSGPLAVCTTAYGYMSSTAAGAAGVAGSQVGMSPRGSSLELPKGRQGPGSLSSNGFTSEDNVRWSREQLQQQPPSSVNGTAASAAPAGSIAIDIPSKSSTQSQQHSHSHFLKQQLLDRISGRNSRSSGGTPPTSLSAPTAAASPFTASTPPSGGQNVIPVAAGMAALQAGEGNASGANAMVECDRRQGDNKDVARAAGGRQLADSDDEEEGTEVKRSEVQVWIVLELCSGGTLKDAVTAGKLKVDNKIEMGKLLSRLLEAANGMAYLHSKGIMHGDLKAGNVLLQNLFGGGDQVAKISDFGLAAVLLDGATHRSTASMGTITHMAPEVLRSGRMSPAADVYSFAIMMWEVLTKQQAYQGLHYGAVVERVVVRNERPVIPSNIPEGFTVLMNACWDPDPDQRPTFEQIITCLELMLDNLSSDESNVIEGDEELDVGDAGHAANRSGAGAAAAAAVVNHLQQIQQQQQMLQQQQQQQQQQLAPPVQQQVLIPLPVLPAVRPNVVLGAGVVGSSTAGSQQQPLTPTRDLQQLTADRSIRTHDSQTLLSTTRSSSKGSRLSGSYVHANLDANQFLHDL